MSEKPRILVLTPRFPYPVIGGDRLRIHAICRALSKDYDLTLLSLCDDKAELNDSAVSDAVFNRIERVFHPRWRSLAKTILALPRRTPLQVAYYQSARYAQRISVLAPKHDLVLAHLIRTGDYLMEEDSPPTVLEMTDAISMNYDRVRQHKLSGLRAALYRIEQGRLAVYERRMPEAFSAISLISSVDARYLWGDTLPENLVIAANGVDCEALPFRLRSNAAAIGVFIGNMHSAQNLDACRYFVDSVLPLLSPHDLQEFRIVGRIRKSDASWFAAQPRVTVTGEVSSIVEAVKDAKFGVCPVRVGAGVQNKILEYMALGLPVVSSVVGHEGLTACVGHDLLVATNAESFAEQITRLAANTGLFESLSKNGRQFVEKTHSWTASLKPLITRIHSELGNQ